MKRALLLSLCLSLSSAARSDSVEEAQQAYADGDFGKAAQLYTKAAKRGDADAQYNLGVMFFNGQGVARDYPEALKWFKKAAAKKVAESHYYIGVIYSEAGGVPPDAGEAAKWFEKAAGRGDVRAQRKLARLLQDGKDLDAALRWYREAALQNDAEALFGLGTMYEAGQGVPRDYAQASDYFARALAGGHPEAKDRMDKLKLRIAEDQLLQIQQHVAQSSKTVPAASTAPVIAPTPPVEAKQDDAWGPGRWAAVGAGCLALVLIPAIVVLRRKSSPAPAPVPAPKKKTQPAPPAGFRPIDAQTLLGAVDREIDVLAHCRYYIQAGQVPALVAQSAGKPGAFCSAYAAALLKLNNYQGALEFLSGKASLSPEDYAVYIAAHSKIGKLDMLDPSQIPEKGKAAFATALMESGKDREAKETLLEGRQAALSPEDLAAVFRLAMRLGDVSFALPGLEEISKSPAAPELSYQAALLCEKNGRLEQARAFYAQIPRHRDAAGRLRRLGALSEDDLKRLAAVMEVFTGSPETPLTRAFSDHFLGRYELSRPLGVGSTGFVYKGSDRASSRDAALKRFPAELAADDKAKAFFLRQAEAAAKVNSPYLAGVFDAVSVESGLFLASAYADGESLSEIMAQRGKFRARALLPLLKVACEAVVAAHEGKVVHGGLKPSEILLDKKGGVRVTGLGFSQLAGRKTEGLPNHGAPELASGAPTVQSDIYSMGLSACELLTGEAPGEPGYAERFAANAGLAATAEGKALREVLLDCLKPDPAARPKTMGQLMSRLQGI